LRRIVLIATAFAVLVAAASAVAATTGFNTYTAKLSFKPNKAGSSHAASVVAYTQNYVASGNNGNRTAPLTDIKTKVYGLVADGKDFPICSQAKIAAAKSDTVCPKGSRVGTGAITAILGPVSSPSASTPGTLPCTPILHAYNGGPGKVVYFFVAPPTGPHSCGLGALTTGGIQPFVGTVKTVGKNLVLDTPIPTTVSFPLPGFEGSLTSETLHWFKLTKQVNGKTVAYNGSAACKHGKRPYSVTFTASMNGQSQSDAVSGTQKCS
jgi:hypothetical protein